MRGPIFVIVLNLTIDAMGIGLILPVMPGLIQEVTGEGLGQAAAVGGLMATTFAIMQFLFGPLIGSLSDRFGRRPILLISLAVMAADYVVLALAGSLWLLFLGRVVGGVAAATQSTALAFIADISEPHEKAARFGLVGAAFGIGFVLGPLVGGVLGEFGTRAPFWAAAALSTLNLVLAWFILPETVTDRTRRAFDWRRANPLGALRHLSKLPGVGLMLGIVFLYEFAFIVYPATWAYYGPAAFGWTPGTVGLSLAGFGVSMALVQGLLIRVVLKRLGERGTVLYAIVFNLVAFLVLAVLTNGTVALLLTPVTALGAVGTPALQGLMSQRVPDDSQGELQGLIASAKAVALIFSPVVMTQIFAAFTTPPGPHLPGAAFGLSAAIMVLCLVLWTARRRATPNAETTP